MSASDYSALFEQYNLKETIGSGGFAKVRLGVHLFSGEKVAVKIVDKQLVGKDLPRIRLEIAALQSLAHQHLARLYQVIESENKIFIILEYCEGGELFDFIVSKERLFEDEARRLFRQIVSVIAYIHSKGYSHRDLKPENVLLDENLNAKLIDFGLCARPAASSMTMLDTCCGSPAYAAPELVSGQSYHGPYADMWSLGVLLYAMLCGFLPFEDDNIPMLYKKIQSGVYSTPAWVSPTASQLISQLLQVTPTKRISIWHLLQADWLLERDCKPIQFRPLPYCDSTSFDYSILSAMSEYYHVPVDVIKSRLSQWKYDDETALYLILLYGKIKGLSTDDVFASRVRKDQQQKSALQNPLTPVSARLVKSPSCDGTSFDRTLDDIDDVFTPIKSNAPSSALKDSTAAKSDVNHTVSASASKCLFKTPQVTKRRRNIFAATPRSSKPKRGNDTPPKRTQSCDFAENVPLSRAQRLNSFEDGIDRIIEFFTPKKRIGSEFPRTVKPSPGVVVTTSSISAVTLLTTLQYEGSVNLHLETRIKGWTVYFKNSPLTIKKIVKFRLEVVNIQNSASIGILAKRIKGDGWEYKRLTQTILENSILQS